MAKVVKKKKDSKREMKYPSDYGSHTSMIDETETAKLKNKSQVALRDDCGIYVTDRSRLNNGMADPNRYSGRYKS